MQLVWLLPASSYAFLASVQSNVYRMIWAFNNHPSDDSGYWETLLQDTKYYPNHICLQAADYMQYESSCTPPFHSCQHTFSYCTFRINASTAVQVEVSFDKLATDRLELWYLYCFELGCLTTNSSMFLWMEGTAMKVDGDSIMVELPYCPSGATATTIRYCWHTDPCSFMKCPYTVAIYQPRPSLWTLIRAAAKFDS